MLPHVLTEDLLDHVDLIGVRILRPSDLDYPVIVPLRVRDAVVGRVSD